MKVLRKPVEFEATQWFNPGDHPAVVMARNPHRADSVAFPWLVTMSGGQAVIPGDWIITSSNGESILVKTDAFHLMYEVAIPPVKTRIVKEKEALDENIKKLSAFLKSNTSGDLEIRALTLLGRQLTAMSVYSNILQERLELL